MYQLVYLFNSIEISPKKTIPWQQSGPYCTKVTVYCMLLGVWKLNTLGLLPTHASDWVSSLAPAHKVGIALQ